MLMNWLNKCDTSHACLHDSGRLEQGRSSLPTRLIDVGNDPHASHVRLVLSQDLSPGFRYLTLSHSWGSSEVAMTVQLTMKNKSSFMTSIGVETLPRTFADTILLARHLGVCYLWIDSLCIVQDDEMDWKTEAAKMAEVYANAYVNVAATASSNSSQGLFRDRNPMTTKRGVATVREGHSLIPAGTYQCFNVREWICQIGRAPLSKRAWVYQEWLLSPRILHFANDQIFWECREMHASETFQDHVPARYEFGLRRFDLESSKEVTKRKFLEIWDTIVQEYTARDLTYVSDKLTALSGLARILHRRHPEAGKYVGGMWAKYLTDQLAWSASCKAHRSNIYRAPSWSWASIDGSISPNFNWRLVNQDHRNRACRSPVTILSIDASFTDDLFGSMIKATLKVEAPLLKITIEAGEGATEDEDDDKNREPIQMMSNTVAGTLSNETERPRPFGDRDFRLLLSAKNNPFFMREGSRGRLDDDRDISAEPELYFMPLLIYNDKLPRFGDEEWPVVDEIIGLVLEPTGAMEGQYKRCGTCTVEEADIELLLCDLGNQRPDEVAYEQWKPGDIGLDDMFPPDYVCKDLDFIPKRFDRFVLSII